MKFLHSFCLILCFSSFGCSSEEKLKAVLDSYVGYPISSLKKQMGEPNEIQKLDDTQAYIYGFSRVDFVPSNTVVTRSSRRYPYTKVVDSFGGYYQRNYCTLKFFTKGTKIDSTKYEGNSCLSYARRKYINPQFVLDLPNLYKVIYGIDYKKTRRGVKITKIENGSHAQNVGLLVDDLITSVNNKNVVGLPIEFVRDIFNTSEQIDLRLIRGNEEKQISVKKTQFPKMSLYKESVKKFLGYSSEAAR
ncbi:MAG: PDZ domain-containing protein [bacterium]